MKKNGAILLLLPLLLIVFAACSDLDDSTEHAPSKHVGEIRFAAAFESESQTKASTDINFKSRFEVGDQIGIFAVKKNTATTADLKQSDNYIHNVKLTLQSDGTWLPETTLHYAPNGEELDFYAYYPYSQLNTNPTAIVFKVDADQSATTDNKSNYDRSHLLASVPTKGVKKDEVVNLNFKHMLAMVNVDVPLLELNGVKLKGVGPRDNLEVWLPEVVTNGTMNLAQQSLTTGQNQEKVKMLRMEKPTDANYDTSYTYRALVPAQNLATTQTISYRQDTRDYLHALAATTLKQGVAKRLRVDMSMKSVHTNLIKAGTFMMGTPEDEPGGLAIYAKQHLVQLTKDFRIGVYEITTAQYVYFLNDLGNVNKWGEYPQCKWKASNILAIDPSSAPGEINLSMKYENGKWKAIAGRENWPALRHPWIGAEEYTYWINGSLPTEAQWEYACRAGNTSPFGLGDGRKLTGEMANIDGKKFPYDLDKGGNYNDPGGIFLNRPTDVGSYAPNAWGLYDMHGNVAEFCNDVIKMDYGLTAVQLAGTTIDPFVGKEELTYDFRGIIIMRGGDFSPYTGYEKYRSASRSQSSITQTWSSNDEGHGFRIVFNQP